MPIRLARPSDAPAILAIYAPYVTDSCISFEEAVPTVEEMTRRIETTLATHPWIVYEREGALVGYAYSGPHRARAAYRRSVDVSVYVAPTAHRSGVGRALYTELIEMLRNLGYYNAFAGITLPNAGSVGLHEAVGFRPVGVYKNVGYKFGRWHDTGWWQLEIQPPSDNPVEPQRISA